MRFPWQPRKPPTIVGCTSPIALNFDAKANVDSGACVMPSTTPYSTIFLLTPVLVIVLFLALFLLLTLFELIFYKPAKIPAKRSRKLGHVPYSKDALPPSIDAVIIGSGQGGLSCGATLSQFGKKVVVLEQHEVTGGGAHCFAVDGKSKWKFDAGLHITIPLQQQVLQLACGAGTPPVPFNRLKDRSKGGVSDRIALSGAPEGEEPLPVIDDMQLSRDLEKRFPEHATSLRRYFAIAETVQASFGLITAAAILPVGLRIKLLGSPLMASWRKWAGIASAAALAQIFPGTDTPTRRLISYITGLWLDQGSPSSRASFFMQSSVFGGWQKIGVAYPQGGPQETALAMVEHIEASGGAVFIRTPVHAILRDEHTGAAIGVELANGDVLRAPIVVSAVGYRATESLLRRREGSLSGSRVLPKPLAPPPKPLATQQSCSFLMANVALRGTASELGISESSLWVQPSHIGNGFDSLKGEKDYFADPLGVPIEGLPVGITFPSLKEKARGVTASGEVDGGEVETGHHTCQLLLPAERSWFEQHAVPHDHSDGPQPPAKHAPPHLKRPDQPGYDALKARWSARLTQLLQRYYPKTAGRIAFVDISTPLTIEHYLRSESGSAIGLDVTPERFVEPSEYRELDMRHPRVPKLWRAGQDYLMAGQVLAAASGLVCALRMLGPLAAARFACRAVLLLSGLKKPTAST